MTDFDDLIETGDLSADERRRLEEVHELLVAAGPPPELPAALREPPAPAAAPVVPITTRRSNRRVVLALIAAALALAVFGAGYLIGDRGDGGRTVRTLELEGGGGSASVSLTRSSDDGNWPMKLAVSGLPKHEGRGYYELFVWRDGKPGYPCVGFKMKQDGTTVVRFTVPYELKDDTRLVVTAIDPVHKWPGRVVMRTV